MKWTTRNKSCVANASPKTTDAPTRKGTVLDPRMVFGRSCDVLKQTRAATETAAANAHNKTPEPNPSPLNWPDRFLELK